MFPVKSTAIPEGAERDDAVAALVPFPTMLEMNALCIDLID
jgi:hypothetical protein